LQNAKGRNDQCVTSLDPANPSVRVLVVDIHCE
jgi:hypothetical protein